MITGTQNKKYRITNNQYRKIPQFSTKLGMDINLIIKVKKDLSTFPHNY